MISNTLKTHDCEVIDCPVDDNYGANPVLGHEVVFSPAKSTSVFERDEFRHAHQEAVGVALAHIVQKLR